MSRRTARVRSFARACWISVGLPEAPATGWRAPLKARLFRNRACGDSRQRVPHHGGPHPIRVAGPETLKRTARAIPDVNCHILLWQPTDLTVHFVEVSRGFG